MLGLSSVFLFLMSIVIALRIIYVAARLSRKR